MDEDRDDPSCHDDHDERALLGDSSEPRAILKEKQCRPENISFPVKDWELMKEQNLRILKELEWFRKKAPMTDPNLGEGARASVVQAAAELPEQDSENFRQPPKKKMKTMITHDESDECDPDDQIEEMMAPNESEGKNADSDMG